MTFCEVLVQVMTTNGESVTPEPKRSSLLRGLCINLSLRRVCQKEIGRVVRHRLQPVDDMKHQ